ncbi:Fic family protein [Solidesulfovibrio carbinolicus]|uniref:Fic family protein n=1 Tax=Solidesulfovibrio carbinolicus TaxID=296842 RepID=A0A4P6HLF6_9BACT|nr:Fic family protein [Solidesulfovibrio carbinolicus]QAZ65918.1 Fic family protein [Solidesulfovibrio carbinolicus]
MPTTAQEIHKVLTFKSGNFVFSRRFDQDNIATELKVFHACYDIIASLPTPPHLAAFLDADLIRKSIFSTAALEGNPLDEKAVGALLEKEGSTTAANDFEREILNLKATHDKFILATNKAKNAKPFLLSEGIIKAVHAAITIGVNDASISPGLYRNTPVQVGNPEHGGTYVPPKILEDIKTLMAAFVDWINGEALLLTDPVIRAALAHYHLAKIHPFRDGNGRTARMIEAMILAAAGYRHIPSILWNAYYRDIHDYYIAFSKSEHSTDDSVQPFLDFYCRSLRAGLEELRERLVAGVKPLLYRDYVAYLKNQTREISPRQHQLIELLLAAGDTAFDSHDLRQTSPFTLLYRQVSDKTIRRDIKNLERLGLICKTGTRYRLIDDAR